MFYDMTNHFVYCAFTVFHSHRTINPTSPSVTMWMNVLYDIEYMKNNVLPDMDNISKLVEVFQESALEQLFAGEIG